MGGRARLSTGAKLTLRYTAAVAVTLTAVALFVYTQVTERINREARLLIELQVEELADEFTAQVSAGSLPEALEWLQGRLERSVANTDPELRLVGEFVSGNGETLLHAGPSDPAPPPVSQSVLDGRRTSLMRAINVGRERPYLSMEARVPGGALRLMIDTRRYANNIRHVRDVFLWSLPLVLALTAASGWLLARGSLRPIARITETARRIGGQNLEESVPETGSDDELDRLAQTLNEMLARLRDALAAMRRFNANAAHQLRTPLAAVSSQLEVTLELERESEEYRRVLAEVLGEVRGMSGSVDAMLRLAQFEAGLEPERLERFDVAHAVETVREFFEPVAEEENVALQAEVPPAFVYGNASWLQQLFSNLVDNALRYSKPGDTVRVQGRLEHSDVVIDVSDQGPGIPPEHEKLVFERFERFDRAAGDPREAGFGLGLAIAQQIARAHGGRIETRTSLRGTTMSVHLPLHVEAP